ncbi:MAG: PGF-pre-PGF domain-containing protein, partial [Halobacteria archaeon]
PVSLVAPPPAAAAPPSSAAAPSAAPAQEVKAISFLGKGATTEVKFSNLRLELEGLKDLQNVEVKYAPLDRRPAGVPFPGGDAYRYFNAEARGLARGDAKVTFIFTVERTWLAQTKASESAIRLLRLPEGAKEWQTLATEAGRSTSTDVEFTARSDGFSIFAIAATGSAPSGGGAPWIPLAVVAAVLLLLVTILRSQRMAPFLWRLRVRFRR